MVRENQDLISVWRGKVFKRDGYRCKLCGKKGRLNAHHIDGWNWAVGLRYNVKNGITLCANKNGCHQKFHETYGSGNNTKYQLDEFMHRVYGMRLYNLDL
jgi:hypothetical protein